MTRRLLRGEFKMRNLAKTGRGVVTRRLLRGEFKMRNLAKTGWGDSGTEIASWGV
ncbi:MAG: hypothetical protein FWG98_10105 [Candidatus Cloacimonetes bacterium]|nr:hypothetical protein [Candidatus Cloacimonadota bacterium]